MRKQVADADEELEDVFDNGDASAESEEDLTQVSSSALSSAVVWGTDWTAATLMDQLQRKTIALDPAFQRRDAWTDERKSRFIESLILGLPIPQLVLAEHERSKGKFIVIDGKQRLLSLSKFTGIGLADDQQPLVLKGLKIRSDLNDETYETLTSNVKYEDLVSAFENQAIRTVVIRGWKNEDILYTIFHRLNTGSVPLSTQELRQALHPGRFLTFAARFSEQSQPLKTLLNLSRPDFRMRDVELVVRFYAFYLKLAEYKGNLKGFLDGICDSLNKDWENNHAKIQTIATAFDKSIQASIKVFSRQHAFCKWDGTRFEKRLNRAIFDVVAHSFANSRLRHAAIENRQELVQGFKDLCLDEEFRSAIESTTKSKKAVSTRFFKWYRLLAKVTGKQVRRDLPK